MTTKPINKIWFILCFIPSVFGIIVATLIGLAFKFQPGGDPAIAFAISFTLAEGMMLVSAIGILATIKNQTKPKLTKVLRFLNIAILIASAFTGYLTFMKMVNN